MRLQKYEEYKESEVTRLGEVPAHWRVSAIKWLSPVLRGASPRPIDDTKYFDDEGEYAWVRIADASASGRVLLQTTQRLSELGSSLSVKLEPGTLFISIAGTVGKPCITGVKACIHDGFVYFPRLQIDQRLLYRHFEYGACYAGLGKMGTQLNLNTDTIGSIRIAVPPPIELQQLLDFLDRETAKIDALIAEQEKLLTLLAEKRQATISHAVTRGLDPNVPLKDSGVAWLGEVPTHWGIVMLRRVVDHFEQGWSPECEARPPEEGEWAVLKAGCVNGGEFASGECKALPSSLNPMPELEIKTGDVLMSRASGSPKLIGSVAILDEPPERLMLSDKIFRLKLAPGIVAQFFALSMRSAPLRQQIEQAIGGADGLANNLSQASIKGFWMTIPPEHEQREIVGQIDAMERAHHKLSKAAELAIFLLRERRSALIAAAVTGKIDVRNLANMPA